MNATELRAAAERLKGRDQEYWFAIHHAPDAAVDAGKVADHILATVHPDDDEPVTEGWLADMATSMELDCIRVRDPETGWELCRDCHGKWDYMGRWIKTPETRGQVRRLLSALGIEVPR